MYFGGSIVLIALGAVLAFAVQDSISGVDLVAVGYIFMLVGVLGIVLNFAVIGPRARRRDEPPPPEI